MDGYGLMTIGGFVVKTMKFSLKKKKFRWLKPLVGARAWGILGLISCSLYRRVLGAGAFGFSRYFRGFSVIKSHSIVLAIRAESELRSRKTVVGETSFNR